MNYWLFKSEPDAFSIDDLFAMPDATDHWDGIRNYQARNLMRDEMKKGDKGFFYHSSCKVPGVIGEVKIVSAAYDDFTALDKKSKYYDPKATPENPRWCMVDVQATKQYKEVIPLTQLKQTNGLEAMHLLRRGNRLSIMPVAAEEWRLIRKMSRYGRICRLTERLVLNKTNQKQRVSCMQIFDTALADVKMIEPQVFGDDRGFFMESFNQAKFEAAGIPSVFVQDNHSRSGQGVLRGLHYQLKHTQGKLVRVTQGEVFDVAVDMRKSSPQFGQWAGVVLSESNKRLFWVPPGFAHGFYVLSESADFQYKCTDYYAPEHERSLLWNDPDVGVEWPILPGTEPQLSAKDKDGERVHSIDTFD